MSNRLAELLRAFDPDLPLERARTIPSSWYHDAEVFALERRAVFGATWQLVGRTDQVMEPGSFVTADLAGEPILVVRDGDGVLRAFYNVCRHHAARVVPQDQGRATRLRCRYHGWTYDLAGRLRGTPEFDGVADFCKDEQGLVPLAVATWGPLVWVHLNQLQIADCRLQIDPGNRQSAICNLQSYLAPLPERTAGLGLETLRFAERREYRLACNWKVFVDNYLDGGYHVNTVHPGLAGVLDYSQYRTEIAGQTSVQISPLKPPETQKDRDVGKVRTGTSAYYWWVFPNFMMNLYQGVMDTNLVLPLAPDSCRVVFDFYFTETESPEARTFIADSIAVGHQIQLEDVGICEEVQRGLASRSYDTGRFSVRREAAGYYFHQLLARRLRAAVGGGGE
jgi:choline monooxygenase